MASTVLFDLDGLLADTESLHCRAYQTVLRQHGLELSDREYAKCWTQQGLGIADFLQARSSSLDPVSLRQLKAAEYVRLIEACCAPMPGALDLLDRLSGRKTVALASSAYADAVQAVLARLGIAGRFACIVTGSDVQRVKPHPDIFLRAAQLLDVPPRQCVVIEDAEKGLRAAKAGGMKCIAVPNEYTADNDFRLADAILPSLDEVTVELIDSL